MAGQRTIYIAATLTFHFVQMGAWAADHYVDLNSANPTPPYSSWATAATNIQDAVDVAVDDDMVWVTNGTYMVTSAITITNDITLSSVNGADTTIVDGGGSSRCFVLTNYFSSIKLEGFTIQNGFSTGYGGNGGGIYCSSTNPIITRCTISENTARDGGGMFRGTAQHSSFKNNEAEHVGGGMYDSIASDCVFEGNTANHGGGIAGDTLRPNYQTTAFNCTFTGNKALFGKGGGAFGIKAVNCLFYDNTAWHGAGIASYANPPYFVTTAINCTITRNVAQKSGGGLHGGVATTNCVVWYNRAGISDDNIENGERVAFTCSPDLVHGIYGNITNAPMLTSSSHIALDSPCVGAGVNVASGYDIDGDTWHMPPAMGCDEPKAQTEGTIQLAVEGLPEKATHKYLADLRLVVEGATTGMWIDFGDGQSLTNALAAHKCWKTPGAYDVILTAENADYPNGLSITQRIQIATAENVMVHVAPTGDDLNSGASWATAKATIQAGVDAQPYAGGAVLVTNGTYLLSSEISVTNDILLQSVHGAEATVIDGGDSHECFYLDNSSCTVHGFTISNGNAQNSLYAGGGIYCTGYAPVVEECIVVSNTAAGGGGMFFGTALDCVFTANTASHSGGGLYLTKAQNCEVSNNTSIFYGGGCSDAFVVNSVVSGNSSSDGGGLHNSTATNCIISDNRATRGGGLHSGHTGASKAYNCVISGNTAEGDGGGLMDSFAYSCLITGNTAENGGGYKYGRAYGCTIYGNTAAVGSALHLGTAWNSIISNNSDPAPVQSSLLYFCAYPDRKKHRVGGITDNPLFIDPAAGDYRLQSNSPCINWGNNDYVTGTMDLDGNPRIVGTHVDIGAYEFQADLGLDSDGNGLPDEWERTHFGYRVLPTENPDGDAANNGNEYIAGTDPTDAASLFAVTNASLSAEGYVVQWEPVMGRSYSVWWSDTLTNDFQLLATSLPYPVNSYTDTVHTVEGASFYQLEVELAE